MPTSVTNDFTWRFGGESGEGIDSTGHILAQAMARYGLHVYTYRSFPSRIRGGLTYYEVRATDEARRARGDTLDICGALGQKTVDASVGDLTDGGLLLWDEDAFTPTYEAEGKEVVEAPLPMTSIADEHGSTIMRNMAGIGATAALLDIDRSIFHEFVEERFASKGEAVVEANRNVIDAGYHHVRDELDVTSPWTTERRPLEDGRRLLINGTQATAFGALAGGCRFVSGYPITPSTDILEWFIDHVETTGGTVVQAEDELAAINMALGANYAGVRAMTATSGPGLSLMTEAVGLAGAAEIPVVLVDVMRSGPSTGMPTKHSQADLPFAVHGGHDTFPRIVLSPSSTEEAFHLVQVAFNYAEMYQCPVLLLVDQDLGISNQTWAGFDLHRVPFDRGKLLTEDELADRDDPHLARYEITDDGVSPRTVPGQPNGLHHLTGVEHEPSGYVSESTANRDAQMDKRARKLDTFRAEHLNGARGEPPVPPVHRFGPEDADAGVVTWGSTRWAVEEAVQRLEADGVGPVGRLVLTHLWPLPEDAVASFLDGVGTAVFVEASHESGLAKLTRQELGYHDRIREVGRTDGTPFRPGELAAELREVL